MKGIQQSNRLDFHKVPLDNNLLWQLVAAPGDYYNGM
jgi:hypothetical protein